MALIGNIRLPLLISRPRLKIPISNQLVSTRKTKLRPCWQRLAYEANNNTTKKYQLLHHLKGDFSKLQFPVDFFIDYERKLEEVRHSLMELRKNVEDPIGSLLFVDAIQRMGMGRHYDEEIHATLEQHHVKTSDRIYGFRSLHDVSLSFRVLRQRGYDVSADVFNDFKGGDGWFKGELKQDMQGLMEMHEAAQVRFEGENILDEAEVFSKQHLYQHLEANNNNSLDTLSNYTVRMRLRYPIHKSITRIPGMNDFLSYDLAGGMNIGQLGELADMDLLVGQSIFHQELHQVSKWWDDLGLTKELDLARNQPIKWYTCSMAMLMNDFSLSDQRVQLSKCIAFIYIIDDIFDLYGTPEELTIFVEAVGNWDYASMDTLPEYLKTPYKALLDTTNEIGRSICEKYGYNPINALKQTWKELCSAFLVEAKWFASGECPRAEDYLTNGKLPFYVDDFGSAEDEHQNGNDGSYMEYYMRDHNNDITHTQMREHMMNMIASEWKRLNRECFHLSHSSQFQEASLNLARMVPLMYDYDDNKRLPMLEKLEKFVLSPTRIDCRWSRGQIII